MGVGLHDFFFLYSKYQINNTRIILQWWMTQVVDHEANNLFLLMLKWRWRTLYFFPICTNVTLVASPPHWFLVSVCRLGKVTRYLCRLKFVSQNIDMILGGRNKREHRKLQMIRCDSLKIIRKRERGQVTTEKIMSNHIPPHKFTSEYAGDTDSCNDQSQTDGSGSFSFSPAPKLPFPHGVYHFTKIARRRTPHRY